MIILRRPAVDPTKPLDILTLEWHADGNLVIASDGRLVFDAVTRRRAAHVVKLHNRSLP